MARAFSSADAKELLTWHHRTIDKLNRAAASREEYKEKVKNASDDLVAQAVLKVLQDIPIEEINRDKKGFRVKALREYGYETIADIAPISVYTIASVRGISEDAAYSIKKIVNDIVSKARQGIKIRLSTDNQSEEATELVLALLQYHCSLAVSDDCSKLLSSSLQQITCAEEDLKVGLNGIRWFFSAKAKKEKAIEAFNLLTSLKDNEYGRNVGTQLDVAIK